MKTLVLVLLAIAPALPAQERQVVPTWLHRYVPSLRERPADRASGSCLWFANNGISRKEHLDQYTFCWISRLRSE